MTPYRALNVFPVICMLQTGCAEPWNSQDGTPDPSFKSFSVIMPVILHGRSKREISSTRELDAHVPSITVDFHALGTNYLLDLELNRDVVSRSAPLRYQRNGTMVTDTWVLNEDENCYYSGRVRGSASSSVAVSTCEGISGLVFDGSQTMFVSPGGPDGRHYLYKEDDLVQNRTCGVSGPPKHRASSTAAHQGVRVKRSSRPREPYSSDRRPRYVELVVVADQMLYRKNGGDLKVTIRRTKEIVNLVNSLYAPLNISVALVGMEVWTEYDQITVSEDAGVTLDRFMRYRRERLVTAVPNDNAQLLTGIDFYGDTVGKGFKGTICTYKSSGGVNMDYSKQVSRVGKTIAHEMGHNFGMEHDTEDCDCQEDKCIMAPSGGGMYWSTCSHDYLARAFAFGMDYCLRNKPASLYEAPVCGNGFVEPGEQCDCGTPNGCDNPCCDAPTCMLKKGAVCATGQCCDLTVCRPKRAGVKCRGAEHECDLSEYCTGNSEYCPDDVHKQNGLECQNGESHCYDGVCRTRDKQCQILWGPRGRNSIEKCYFRNSDGNEQGNCGYGRFNKTYQPCEDQDIMCGMLHCAYVDQSLELSRSSPAINSVSYRGKRDAWTCRTATVDFGLRDLGMVPNGAPCGYKRMCVEQKCVAVDDITEGLCPGGCGGNGVCNSLGHCHCDPGWGPPHCLSPGDGGSLDSGPSLDRSAARLFVMILLIVFPGLVPAAAIIFCCVYVRRNNISFKKTFQPSASGTAGCGTGGPDWAGGLDRRAGKLAAANGHGRPGAAPPLRPVGSDTGGGNRVNPTHSETRLSPPTFSTSRSRKPAQCSVIEGSSSSSQAPGHLLSTVPSQSPPAAPPASLKSVHSRLNNKAAARPSGSPPSLPMPSNNGNGRITAGLSVPTRRAPGVPPTTPAASLKSKSGYVTNTSKIPSPPPTADVKRRLEHATSANGSAVSGAPAPVPAAILKNGLSPLGNKSSSVSKDPPQPSTASLNSRLGHAANRSCSDSKEPPRPPAASSKPGRLTPGMSVTATPPTHPPATTAVGSDPAGGASQGRVAELRARLNLNLR